MIDCVSPLTNHHFIGNPLKGQHELRYKEVIAKEGWDDLYVMDGMEFDEFDNIATEYYVARDEQGAVLGITRSYPTTIPYMLERSFQFLFDNPLMSSPDVLEASRLVLDRERMDKQQRLSVVNELMVAYMERGLQRGLRGYVGFMLPKIWQSTFLRVGWGVEWLGPEVRLPKTNYFVRAGFMPVSEALNNKVRDTIKIYDDVLNFGYGDPLYVPEVATYSNTNYEERIAA